MVTDAAGRSIRPRPASVIAVVWLYLGGSWAFMGIVMGWLSTAMLGFLHVRPLAEVPSDITFLWCWFLAITAVGAAGIRGALGLLKLKASGRALLEKVNWLSAGLFATFGFYSAHSLLSSQWTTDTELKLAIYSVFWTGISSVPFLWMGKALRGREVRNACDAAHD
ncbi:MAG: hypothetical protein ABI548_21270 [Polyangiaceae bacterium]